MMVDHLTCYTRRDEDNRATVLLLELRVNERKTLSDRDISVSLSGRNAASEALKELGDSLSEQVFGHLEGTLCELEQAIEMAVDSIGDIEASKTDINKAISDTMQKLRDQLNVSAIIPKKPLPTPPPETATT